MQVGGGEGQARRKVRRNVGAQQRCARTGSEGKRGGEARGEGCEARGDVGVQQRCALLPLPVALVQLPGGECQTHNHVTQEDAPA